MKKLLTFLFLIATFSGIAQDYRTDDNKAIKLYEGAMNELQYGSYETAEEMLQKAVERDAEFLDAKFDLAQLYLLTKREDQGKKLLKSVFEIDAEWEPAVGVTLGTMEIRDGKLFGCRKNTIVHVRR